MTPLRWLIVLFWAFIGVMLIRQFYDYNSKLEKETLENYQSRSYSAPSSVAPTSSEISPNVRAAKVQQIAFSIKDDTPSPGSFTAYVVLKNQGNAKAVGVQVMVRPYRGIIIGGVDQKMSTTLLHPLSDNDPLSQLNQWVTCPDLVPGETCTESVVFLSHPRISPGRNPNPQITFETEKVNP